MMCAPSCPGRKQLAQVADNAKKETGHPAQKAEEPNLPLPRGKECHQKKNTDAADYVAKFGLTSASPGEGVDGDERPDNDHESDKKPPRQGLLCRWRRYPIDKTSYHLTRIRPEHVHVHVHFRGVEIGFVAGHSRGV
jgi:hypothetical protein